MAELTSTKKWRIVECFYSLQGEGIRAGTPNIFIRCTGCNLTCKKETHNFDCDTEFTSGRSVSLVELLDWVKRCSKECKSIIFTGGEPALQLDKEICQFFKGLGYYLCIETNGSISLSEDLQLDWITVSPKVAEHCIRQLTANEVKYVRGYGQGVPKTVVKADNYLISPAFSGNELEKDVLDWCIKLCLDNPLWRLSQQQHKGWSIR